MNDLLKLAADAGHHVSTAEEALAEGAHESAREALDRAADSLEALRSRWPAMTAAERGIIGPSAKAVRARLDAASVRVPVRRALSEIAVETDPEQDRAPDESGPPSIS